MAELAWFVVGVAVGVGSVAGFLSLIVWRVNVGGWLEAAWAYRVAVPLPFAGRRWPLAVYRRLGLVHA